MVGGRTEKAGAYLRFCVIVLHPLTTLLWRRRWIGLDRIPKTGPAILAINHISYADPLFVARMVWDMGRSPRFLAKASLFHAPVIGRVMSGAGQIPVDRGTADADRALAGAVSALRRGEMVLIYPEGTVTRDPHFWPMLAKTGIARLVLLAPEVPVIPVGQWGAQEFLDYYARRFRPFPRKQLTASVGLPMDLADFRGASSQPAVLRDLTNRIMVAVRDQVGEIRGQVPPEEFSPRPAEVRRAPDEHGPSDDPKPGDTAPGAG